MVHPHDLHRPRARLDELGIRHETFSHPPVFTVEEAKRLRGSLKGAHTYRQPSLYFPTPGGTFAGESLPGEMTWARAYDRDGELWMDIGWGEVVKLPEKTRDAWWEGTTRQWPFMAADMGIGRDTLMAHYLSNHVAVAYGDIFQEMVALSQELGFRVRILRD